MAFGQAVRKGKKIGVSTVVELNSDATQEERHEPSQLRNLCKRNLLHRKLENASFYDFWHLPADPSKHDPPQRSDNFGRTRHNL